MNRYSSFSKTRVHGVPPANLSKYLHTYLQNCLWKCGKNPSTNFSYIFISTKYDCISFKNGHGIFLTRQFWKVQFSKCSIVCSTTLVSVAMLIGQFSTNWVESKGKEMYPKICADFLYSLQRFEWNWQQNPSLFCEFLVKAASSSYLFF